MHRFEPVPLTLTEANAYVDALHRHHDPVNRDKYRIGCALDGKLVGVVQVGNPVARMLCDGKTLEVVRLCTDGTPHVCSFLYSAAARVAKELGYSKIITYILEDEPGTSLTASGWKCDGVFGGGQLVKKKQTEIHHGTAVQEETIQQDTEGGNGVTIYPVTVFAVLTIITVLLFIACWVMCFTVSLFYAALSLPIWLYAFLFSAWWDAL